MKKTESATIRARLDMLDLSLQLAHYSLAHSCKTYAEYQEKRTTDSNYLRALDKWVTVFCLTRDLHMKDTSCADWSTDKRDAYNWYQKRLVVLSQYPDYSPEEDADMKEAM